MFALLQEEVAIVSRTIASNRIRYAFMDSFLLRHRPGTANDYGHREDLRE